MISLSLTKEGSSKYVVLNGFLMGPVTDPRIPIVPEVVTSRSSYDHLNQERGRFRENNVDNLQIIADLKHQPLDLEISPAPTVNYPDRVRWQCKTIAGVPTTTFASFGPGLPDKVGMWNTAYEWKQELLDRSDPYDVRIISVTAGKSSTYLLFSAVTVWRYRCISVSGNQFTYELSHYTFTGLAAKINARNWGVRQSAATIRGLIPSSGYTLISDGTKVATIYALSSALSLSIRDTIQKVETLAMVHLEPVNYPIPEKHFGDLAMEASDKVNANQVNMIAFLKDLRRPQELLPKLRNLRKLKTLANNYLVVKYGWLPTVSDLKEIWEAFHRAKPYFDPHGFKVYTSAHRETLVDGVRSFELEQHIKIAIDDTDEGVKDLIGRLDSIGFLPTFENVWDLLPYSFVVDWFTDVGGLLERIDSKLRLSRLGIRYTTMSLKKTGTYHLVPTPDLPFSGTIKLVHYHRWTSDQCPVPPLSVPLNGKTFNHWLEASALILQRTRK